MDYSKKFLEQSGEDMAMTKSFEQQNNMQNVWNLEAIINEGLRVALLEETPDQSLQVLLKYLGKALKGIALFYIFQVLNNNMSANAKIPIPAGTHFPGNILKILLLWLHSISHPLIGVVISTRFILLKDIGSFSVQCFSQIFK